MRAHRPAEPAASSCQHRVGNAASAPVVVPGRPLRLAVLGARECGHRTPSLHSFTSSSRHQHAALVAGVAPSSPSAPLVLPTGGLLQRQARRGAVLARAQQKDQEELVQRVAQQVQLGALEFQPPAAADSSSASGDFPAPPDSPSQHLAPGTQLQGASCSYTITRVLGQGGSATTYQATSSSTGQPVAIKALSLRAARDWKQLTLFQREAQTLKALSHPGIPRYVDYFEVDTPTDRAFYLVQEEVAGKSLAQMVSEGQRCNTEEATRIAVALCEILSYLSSLHPPVVHRDVKPENIVLEGGQWGGRVYLVDFGGVVGVAAAAQAQESFMSTVVGTYGYMAPEQFRGAAQPASDAYALGATLLFLLSGRAPFAFPQERMRIAWKGTSSSPGFQAPSRVWEVVLDGLLEPVAEDRLTPRQALDLLTGRAATLNQWANSDSGRGTSARQRGSSRAEGAAEALLPPMSPAEARQMAVRQLARQQGLGPGVQALVPVRKPAGTRVQVDKSANRLDIVVPPKGLGSAETLMTGSFAIAWNAFVAFWTVGALASGGILMSLFSLPFWCAGFQLGKQTIGTALLKERLAIGRNKFRLGQQLALLNKDTGTADFLDESNGKLIEGATSDLRGARIVTTMFVNDQPQTAIELIEGVRKHRFGEGLDLEEQRWLVSEINQQVEAMQGPIDFSSWPAADVPENVRSNDQAQDPFNNNNNQ